MSESEEVRRLLLQPRVFLNGFPKSGLHLVWLIVRLYCQPAWTPRPWAGTFEGNSWTDRWSPPENWYYRASMVNPGGYVKSHCGYKPEYADFLNKLGVAHVFIYRDLRDVAVSTAYHWEQSHDSALFHPEPELFEGMSHEDVLDAVLTGIQGEKQFYAGLFDRWAHYAPWLDDSNCHSIRFEEMRAKPLETTAAMLGHIYRRPLRSIHATAQFTDEAFDEEAAHIVGELDKTDESPTFRKGTVGQWREEFTPRIKRLFKLHCGDWLERLGYEEDGDW